MAALDEAISKLIKLWHIVEKPLQHNFESEGANDTIISAELFEVSYLYKIYLNMYFFLFNLYSYYIFLS